MNPSFLRWFYHTKPITKLSSEIIKNFFWQNIICRFGVPREITVNNAKKFDNDMFNEFCHQIEMKVAFASVYHPQSNDAVERSNTSIFEAIEKILQGRKMGKWAKVMLKAIWSHNTTISRATNFTPFRLLFGAEAVLPEEVKHTSFWITMKASPCPTETEDKDLLELERLKAVANLEKYQVETKAWRDLKVKPKAFDVGDLVFLWSLHWELREIGVKMGWPIRGRGKVEARGISPLRLPGQNVRALLERGHCSSFLRLSKLCKAEVSWVINEPLL
jgi:hypothetical protein